MVEQRNTAIRTVPPARSMPFNSAEGTERLHPIATTLFDVTILV